MSVAVPIDGLADELTRRDFGYLLTVSDDGRPHLVALRPTVVTANGETVLRFDAGGGRACRNSRTRPQVSIVFPPTADTDGFSLVVDGEAAVDDVFVAVRATSAVLHRPAP